MLLYRLGRALQVLGLLSMPAAIWAAELRHSEAGAIGLFAGSAVIFFVGTGLTRMGPRL